MERRTFGSARHWAVLPPHLRGWLALGCVARADNPNCWDTDEPEGMGQ
jgi:hypothetical protein